MSAPMPSVPRMVSGSKSSTGAYPTPLFMLLRGWWLTQASAS